MPESIGGPTFGRRLQALRRHNAKNRSSACVTIRSRIFSGLRLSCLDYRRRTGTTVHRRAPHGRRRSPHAARAYLGISPVSDGRCA